MKNKFFCAHAHFHEPPRENPWLESIDPEESAHPYAHSTEKAHAECYGPNAACAILDSKGSIVELADNYRRLSFDFNASLLDWIKRERPLTYHSIIDADRQSCRQFDGHGNALAQPYYHIPLPSQSLREKRTLVRWGLDDFRKRFSREPEGFWLPENAADEETLELLIAEGLKFTILKPGSALRVREVGGGLPDWKQVNAKTLNPTRPYRWLSRKIPGREIAIFFPHRILNETVVSGEAFLAADTVLTKIRGRYHPDDSTQLVSLAAAGECFGIRERAGAAGMAATFSLARQIGIQTTNYAQFLSLFAPPQEIEIAGPVTPNRSPLERLAAELDAVYAKNAGASLRDFWHARDNYGVRLAAACPEGDGEFLERACLPVVTDLKRKNALKLLELQRHRLAMLAAESAQSLKHAARAAELAETFGVKLAGAPHEKTDLSCRSDLFGAAAHFAICDHIGLPVPQTNPGYCAKRLKSSRLSLPGRAGKDRSFSLSSWEILYLPTSTQADVTACVHQGDRVDLRCWVVDGTQNQPSAQELEALFAGLAPEDFNSEISRRMGLRHYGLESLFPGERKNAMRSLLPAPMEIPRRRAHRQAWAKAVSELRLKKSAGDEILERLAECSELEILPDQLPWIGEVRRHLLAILEAVLAQPTPENLSRAARWLSALERAGLHMDIWELQQFFWRWRLSLKERQALPNERETAQALGESLRFSPAVWAEKEGTPA